MWREIDAAASSAGLVLRGGFHPHPDDAVPEAGPGAATRTLILLGNAGPRMWEAFRAARDPSRDRLDDWSEEVIGSLAARFGARALFPFTRPHLPFQRWAARAEPCHVSPIGITIHPRYGLWHAYRGALAFPVALELPRREDRPSPCERCADRPCLGACPAGAFGPGGYDVPACVAHLEGDAGAACLAGGCLARHACPVGTRYRYAPAQAAFHMAHFLRARRAAG